MAMSALAEVQFARGDLEEAERLFTRCLGKYPNFLGVVLPAAATILRRGADAETAAARIEELVASMTPSVRFMLGTALYEAGHPEAAEAQFRRVLEAQPSSEPALLALGEALLSQSRWDEAVELSGTVESEVSAAVAARTQMFAAIMSGDESLATAAIERGAAAAVPAHELAVFRSWSDAVRGAESLPALPPESVPLLGVALEALLRVREVDAFCALLKVLDAAALPSREKRELLGTIYLRRGFVDSAADEWLAACEDSGPDSRALLGLAQVAYARELRDDALVLAAEASTLDPQNAGAARLVEALSA
jgi:tetratricopeptide (TPR) repeat protein